MYRDIGFEPYIDSLVRLIELNGYGDLGFVGIMGLGETFDLIHPSGISVDNSQISEQEEIEIDEEQNNFNIGSCAKAIILIFFYLFFGNLYFIIKAFEVHRYIQLITYLLFYISFFFSFDCIKYNNVYIVFYLLRI